MPEPVQAEPEGMDTDAATEVTESAAAGESAKMDTNGSDASDAAAAAQNGDKADKPSPPKQVVKSVELQVDSKTSSLPLQSLQDLTESEVRPYIRHLIIGERVELDTLTVREYPSDWLGCR